MSNLEPDVQRPKPPKGTPADQAQLDVAAFTDAVNAQPRPMRAVDGDTVALFARPVDGGGLIGVAPMAVAFEALAERLNVLPVPHDGPAVFDDGSVAPTLAALNTERRDRLEAAKADLEDRAAQIAARIAEIETKLTG